MVAIQAAESSVRVISVGKLCMTSYLSRKLLTQWSLLVYMVMGTCTLLTLVQSSVDQLYYVTSSLAASDTYMIPVGSNFILLPIRATRFIGL